MRAQSGDEDAFDELYNKYRSLVKGIVRRLLGNREAVDDVVQDTFTAVWHSLHKGELRSASSMQAWLKTIARNKVVDHLRKSKRMYEVGDLDSKFPTIEADVNIEGAICRKESWSAALERAWTYARGSPVLDLALRCLLLHLAGFSSAEITLILPITLSRPLGKNSIHTYLSRARGVLRLALWEIQQNIPLNDEDISQQRVIAYQEKSGQQREEDAPDSDFPGAESNVATTGQIAAADPWGAAWERLKKRATPSTNLDLSLKCFELYNVAGFSCTEIRLILQITLNRSLEEKRIRSYLLSVREELRLIVREIQQDIELINDGLEQEEKENR